MFQKLVMEDGTVEIINVFEKQEHKSRPAGLNTVNLLKVCTYCCLLACIFKFSYSLAYFNKKINNFIGF